MQTVIQIVFVLIAALIIGAGLMVVTVKNIIHSALWLITSFFGVAALYFLLEAEFIAIVQILIYVGAISVLVLFAIMLTNQLMRDMEQPLYRYWWVALIIATTLFTAIITPTVMGQEWKPFTPSSPEGGSTIAGAIDLGKAFMREYLLHFQLAGILLLVALIGAIVIAYEERHRRRQILTLAEEFALGQQQTSESDKQMSTPTTVSISPTKD